MEEVSINSIFLQRLTTVWEILRAHEQKLHLSTTKYHRGIYGSVQKLHLSTTIAVCMGETYRAHKRHPNRSSLQKLQQHGTREHYYLKIDQKKQLVVGRLQDPAYNQRQAAASR